MSPFESLISKPLITTEEAGDCVLELFAEAFPREDGSYIAALFKEVGNVFAGGLEGFQPMDTAYHDLDHTLKATLCWVKMMLTRNRIGNQPYMDAGHFHTGLHGILMHDLGYLKDVGDTVGTGAKFTFVHERRSCEIAQIILRKRGWNQSHIFSVQHLISCTGPRAVIDGVPFYSPLEKWMGKAVCAADYLGQMSDIRYIEKIPALFFEFQESDNFREIPMEKRQFKTCDELLRKTPSFWNYVRTQVLEGECSNIHTSLNHPYPDGPNIYVQMVEQNIKMLETIIFKV
jgi:hypothetical protein